MSLEITRSRNRSFFARLNIDGVVRCFTLATKVRGNPPQRLSEQGDVEFEISRAEAQIEHDALATLAREKRRKQQWLEKIYEAKTGSPVPSVSLDKMHERWAAVSYSKAPRWRSQVKVMHEQFVEFVAMNYPKAKEMADIDEPIARAFMAIIEAEEFAPGTFNKKLDNMRSVFNYLSEEAGILKNPFDCIETQEDAIVNRIPFTESELELVLDVSQRAQHSLVYPAVLTASQTAQRRADCCLLAWSSIDLETNSISVRAAKTKKLIRIPITPRLRTLLLATPKTDSSYVFPDLAREFLRNPDSITDRTRAVFKEAGFFNPTSNGAKPIGSVQIKREKGKGVRAASVRDFQALRATWVTIALMSGVAMEVVLSITGHSSEETLRKHYFLPGFEAVRQMFSQRLPEVLGGDRIHGAAHSEKWANVVEKLKSLNPGNCRRLKKEMLALIGGEI